MLTKQFAGEVFLLGVLGFLLGCFCGFPWVFLRISPPKPRHLSNSNLFPMKIRLTFPNNSLARFQNLAISLIPTCSQ